MDVKTCPHCSQTKTLTEFFKKGNGQQSWCKTCTTARRAEWGRENPDKVTAAKLWNRYRLRLEDFEALWKKQNGLCSVGGEDLSLETPHVDHDHLTGVVRGLLCKNCNTKLGRGRRS